MKVRTFSIQGQATAGPYQRSKLLFYRVSLPRAFHRCYNRTGIWRKNSLANPGLITGHIKVKASNCYLYLIHRVSVFFWLLDYRRHTPNSSKSKLNLNLDLDLAFLSLCGVIIVSEISRTGTKELFQTKLRKLQQLPVEHAVEHVRWRCHPSEWEFSSLPCIVPAVKLGSTCSAATYVFATNYADYSDGGTVSFIVPISTTRPWTSNQFSQRGARHNNGSHLKPNYHFTYVGCRRHINININMQRPHHFCRRWSVGDNNNTVVGRCAVSVSIIRRGQEAIAIYVERNQSTRLDLPPGPTGTAIFCLSPPI